MKNLFQFYVFDEHTDYERECIKLGMKPSSKLDRLIKTFTYMGYEYIVLNRSDCYSGWEYTVMKLPQMNFDQLYKLEISTKIYDEKVGALGMILKYYDVEFTHLIKKAYENEIPNRKQIKKISELILTQIKERSDYVDEMKDLLKLCYEICYS